MRLIRVHPGPVPYQRACERVPERPNVEFGAHEAEGFDVPPECRRIPLTELDDVSEEGLGGIELEGPAARGQGRALRCQP